jgi:hypothetical protein
MAAWWAASSARFQEEPNLRALCVDLRPLISWILVSANQQAACTVICGVPSPGLKTPFPASLVFGQAARSAEALVSGFPLP